MTLGQWSGWWVALGFLFGIRDHDAADAPADADLHPLSNDHRNALHQMRRADEVGHDRAAWPELRFADLPVHPLRFGREFPAGELDRPSTEAQNGLRVLRLIARKPLRSDVLTDKPRPTEQLSAQSAASGSGIRAMPRSSKPKLKKPGGNRTSELSDWISAFGCALLFMFVFRNDTLSTMRSYELGLVWATILAAMTVIFLTCLIRPILNKYSEWFHDVFHRTMR
jgi:hypothetical protein